MPSFPEPLQSRITKNSFQGELGKGRRDDLSHEREMPSTKAEDY